MTELFWMDVRNLENPAAMQRAQSCIFQARREKIEQFQNPHTARLSLGAGYLLSLAMAQYQVSGKENALQYGAHGKPYLVDTPFHFSLSHSGNGALCAFGTAPVGADLQKIKPALPRHTKRILSPEESAYLEGLPEGERVQVFYRLWARKESLMKWDGRGLRLPPHQFSFVQNGNFSDTISFSGKRLWIREYSDFLPEYALSICSESPDFSPAIKKILII